MCVISVARQAFTFVDYNDPLLKRKLVDSQINAALTGPPVT